MKKHLCKGACDSYLIATLSGTLMPVFITKLTTNASRYIRGRITKSIPDSLDRSGDVFFGSTLITSTLGFAGVVLRVLLLRGVVGVVNELIIK